MLTLFMLHVKIKKEGLYTILYILSLFLSSVDIFINSNNKNLRSFHHASQQDEFL